MHSFHLAFPVNDLAKARFFYVDLLGCSQGRSSETWVDFDFYGHQISAHLNSQQSSPAVENPVDGDQVPVPHFGLILDQATWQDLAERIRTHGFRFVIEPKIRFQGKAGEQGTFFLRDPAGNALEFKYFEDQYNVFATDDAN
jgi:hypothetical protein